MNFGTTDGSSATGLTEAGYRRCETSYYIWF